MSTPTGGYRRNFITQNTDIPYNTGVDAYTCPAGKKAVVELRSAIATVNGPGFFTTTLKVFIKQTDGNGNTFILETFSGDVASSTTITTSLFFDFKSSSDEKQHRYYLNPGDIIRFSNTIGGTMGKNGAVPIRVKAVIVEEENSDI